MDESDDNFAWTDASSDSSKNMAIEVNHDISEPDSDYGDTCKAILQKKLAEVSVEEKRPSKKRKKQLVNEEVVNNFNGLDRSIKSEPNSDFDIPKQKKRLKNEEIIIDTDLNETENYLNCTVKQEQQSCVEPVPVKSKKKKKIKNESKRVEGQESETSLQAKDEIDIVEHGIHGPSFVQCEYSNISDADTSRRKKKKKKKHSEDNTRDLLDEIGYSPKRRKALENKAHTSEELLDYHSGDNDSALQLEGNGSCNIVSSTLIKSYSHDNNYTKEYEEQNFSLLVNGTESGDHVSLIDGPLKRSRISERLQFEEDNADVESEERRPIDTSVPLTQFLDLNTHLKPMQPTSHSGALITQDDEVWILKGPQKIAIGDLEKTTLHLDREKKVKIRGTSYDSIINHSICSTPIVSFDEKHIVIKNVTLNGSISLRNRVPKVHIPYESLTLTTEHDFIPLPDTKCRHPLFGAHYKKASKIPKAIAQRLHPDSSSVPIDVVKKKKKKHKIKEQFESDLEVKRNSELSHPHKKKRKHSEDGAAKKAKRIKHDPECVDTWDSEQAIENNLFNF